MPRTHQTSIQGANSLSVKRLSDNLTMSISVNDIGDGYLFQTALDDKAAVDYRLGEPDRYSDITQQIEASNLISGKAHDSLTTALEAVKSFFDAAARDERAASPVSFPPPDDD